MAWRQVGQGLQNLKMRPAVFVSSDKFVVAVGLEQTANSNVKNVHFMVFSEALVGHLELLKTDGKQYTVQVHGVTR